MTTEYTLELQPDTVALVSYWYIPGGTEYDKAQVRIRFYADIEDAKRFADQNAMPPEMADLVPISKCKKCGKQLRVLGKCGYDFVHKTLNQYCWVDPTHGSQLHEPL
jgi:hypothetical protein